MIRPIPRAGVIYWLVWPPEMVYTGHMSAPWPVTLCFDSCGVCYSTQQSSPTHPGHTSTDSCDVSMPAVHCLGIVSLSLLQNNLILSDCFRLVFAYN